MSLNFAPLLPNFGGFYTQSPPELGDLGGGSDADLSWFKLVFTQRTNL